MNFTGIGDVFDDLFGGQIHEVLLGSVRDQMFSILALQLSQRSFQFVTVRTRMFQGGAHVARRVRRRKCSSDHDEQSQNPEKRSFCAHDFTIFGSQTIGQMSIRKDLSF